MWVLGTCDVSGFENQNESLLANAVYSINVICNTTLGNRSTH